MHVEKSYRYLFVLVSIRFPLTNAPGLHETSISVPRAPFLVIGLRHSPLHFTLSLLPVSLDVHDPDRVGVGGGLCGLAKDTTRRVDNRIVSLRSILLYL